jgi:dihydrofolate reductase
MRKLVVLSFMSLDGVIQSSGEPEEDPTGGFKVGGWTLRYFDDHLQKVMLEQMSGEFDLLLGRKTYEIFAALWPYADSNKDPIAAGINKARKYVVSRSLDKLDWNNSFLIKDNVIEEIKALKEDNGPDIQVHGSGGLIQTLLEHDLVDELWLKTFPVTLGGGKRLFGDGTIAAGFELFESSTTTTGVVIANYRRAGEVKIGRFITEPTEAERERRKRLAREDMNNGKI